MTDINLKTLTPDTSLPTTGFLFGADSQASTHPSVYSTQTVATTLLGSTSLTGDTLTGSSAPVLNLTQTWNNGSTTFKGVVLNVTDTNSTGTSLLMDLGTGGGTFVSKFSISKFGTVTASEGATANILALRNTTNAQTFRVYNTYTDASNYERGVFDWTTTANVLTIAAQNAGTGTARSMVISTASGNTLQLNNGYIYVQLSNYNFVLGNSLTLRWNNSTAINPPSDGNLTLQNNAQNSFGLLQLGGTTSSFPALKRSTTFLQARLADDSAFAGFASANMQAATAYTVATLPGTPGTGMIARVSDASAPVIGTTVAGGGAAYALVNYNGANWTVIGV